MNIGVMSIGFHYSMFEKIFPIGVALCVLYNNNNMIILNINNMNRISICEREQLIFLHSIHVLGNFILSVNSQINEYKFEICFK